MWILNKAFYLRWQFYWFQINIYISSIHNSKFDRHISMVISLLFTQCKYMKLSNAIVSTCVNAILRNMNVQSTPAHKFMQTIHEMSNGRKTTTLCANLIRAQEPKAGIWYKYRKQTCFTYKQIYPVILYVCILFVA